jgi:hypothetical protein
VADSDKLIGKVDALLGRHRAADSGTEPPADFPVLTEVVQLPAAAPAEAGPALSERETRLHDAILAKLAPEIERHLAEPLKMRLDELLDWAMQTVKAELDTNIKSAVRSAVAKAVDEALIRRRGDSSSKR